MILVKGEGECVGAEAWLEFQSIHSQARKEALLLLCGFERDENDQQNDPAHQRNDV